MKSLELNWIKKFDKSLVIPEVIYYPIETAGVYYYPTINQIYDMEGYPHDMNFGVIVVNPEFSNIFDGIIAHEWRHHWQLFHWGEIENNFTWDSETMLNNYDENVIKFFNYNSSELDALRFQYRYSKIYPSWEELFCDNLLKI